MDQSNDDKFDISRIASFSDGVFAFAVTLLVVSFDVPRIPPHLIDVELPKQILSQLPNMISYITSFLVVGGFWYSHHQKFRYIHSYDGIFLWLNLILLMCIAFLPFSTDLVGEYSNSFFAIVLYCGSVIVAGLALTLVWFYATLNHHLVDKNLSKKIIHREMYNSLVIPIVFLTSILLAFIHIDIAIYAWILVIFSPIFYNMGSKFKLL